MDNIGEHSRKALEEASRPSARQIAMYHLDRLAVIKRFENDSRRWGHFCDQLLDDIEGVSEYAVVEACDWFKNNCESPFFPTYKELKDTIFQIEGEVELMKKGLPNA